MESASSSQREGVAKPQGAAAPSLAREVDLARENNWVTMAVLGKPRGIRGELFALPQTNHWERFREGRSFRAWFPPNVAQHPRDLVLEEAWSHNGKLILKFVAVDSMDAAEQLRGAALCIPETDRDPLPEGEFYYDDLKGMAVVDLATGQRLGTVTGFTEGIGPGVVEVVSRGAECIGSRDPEEWQIPFAIDICVEVDMEQQQLRVCLPEGLRELNQQ